MWAVVKLSHFSWHRHNHPNPENIHTVTDMQEWLNSHPYHNYQKIAEQILALPQKNMELSFEIQTALFKTWKSVFFWAFVNTDEKERKMY